jgi:murein DD-endopeptidase MepM/ murein hydrolase activator NlpD
VRARPLFVRHAPLRRLRRSLLPGNGRALVPGKGLAGPLALAAALAFAGHQLAATTAAPVVRPGAASAPYAMDRPEHGALGTPGVAGPARPSRARDNVVARRVPATPSRASRSTVRRALWVRPAHGPLTSHFGYRWGKLHKGIDIGAAWGSPIYAAADGVVTYAGPQGGYGRLVTIRHADGTVTAYGHMSRFATHTGARVHAGDVIAYVGSEGHSTGPHLHFEVRVGGVAIDPLPFLRARGIYF